MPQCAVTPQMALSLEVKLATECQTFRGLQTLPEKPETRRNIIGLLMQPHAIPHQNIREPEDLKFDLVTVLY